MKSKDSINTYSLNAEELSEYLKRKAEKHNHYKLYSTLDRIVEIRDKQCLYLGNGEKWNDIPDRKSFNSDEFDYINFGKCFSFSKDENVAMWMLYGGLDKKSGMIDFTNKGINDILSIKSVDIGFFSENDFVLLQTLQRDSFKIYIIDILYFKENNGSYYVRRSEETINDLSPDIFNKLIGCKKAYPWRYESECRLIVSINKRFLNKKCDFIRIDLSVLDLGKSLDRIYHGPNYPLEDKKNSLPSALNNTIDWTLCDGVNCSLKTI